MPAGVDILTSLLKVAVVFGLLFITLRALSRYQRGQGGRRSSGPVVTGPLVEIVDERRVGRNANLATVKVGDRILLIGLTDTNINTLADVSNDIDLTVEVPEDSDQAAQSSVLDHAMDILKDMRRQ
jgi:flagellar biogenesis protein FliO